MAHFNFYPTILGAFLFLISSSSCIKHPEPEIIEEVFVPPISIEGLRQKDYTTTLTLEEEFEWTDFHSSSLMSYYSDSLKVYTLVTTPTDNPPEKGFPVLIFGHGFHPDPSNYSINSKTGNTWRPGEYYRGIPEAYAKKGFMVFTPDYRGHNASEGFEYTQSSYLDANYYARDVLYLIHALSQLENVDASNLFFMGHAMGGDVGLTVLAVTDKIKAASLWAPVSVTTYEQAFYYGSRNSNKTQELSTELMKHYMKKVDTVISKLGYHYDISSGDPIHFLSDMATPIIIHHARWEGSVPYQWSERLAVQLFRMNKPFELHTYDSENHLLMGTNRRKAIERDLKFFQKKSPRKALFQAKDY